MIVSAPLSSYLPFKQLFCASMENELKYNGFANDHSKEFARVYSTIEDFIKHKNINLLLSQFEKLRSTLKPDSIVPEYLACWTADAYEYVGEYDKAWEYKKGIRVHDVLNLRARCKDTSLGSLYLLDMLRSKNGLTKFVLTKMDEIIQLVTLFLKNSHKENRRKSSRLFLQAI